MKKKNLLEARSRSEKLDAVLLLDVDENETAEGAEEGEEEGKKKEKKKSRSLRGLVEIMVEKAKMHFDRNDSEAMVSSIFLDDAMNLSVANASVQSNGVLIIPVSAKSVVLKSARLVIIARAKEWVKVSFSPLSNNDYDYCRFVVLVITDAYAMHKQTKNSLATSGTIATLFSEEMFYYEALAADSVAAFREAMCRFLHRHGGDVTNLPGRTFSLLETTLGEEEAERGKEQKIKIEKTSLSKRISVFARISDDFHRVVKKRY